MGDASCKVGGSAEVPFTIITESIDDGGGTRSAMRPFRSETLLIWDWDDTLLCTSAINFQEWTSEQLEQLESLVKAVLHRSIELGETWIVTNGIESWVEHSAAHYLPGLLPLLSRIRIISARAKYEDEHPGDPFIWKRKIFKDLLTDYRGNHQDTRGGTSTHEWTESAPLNLIVIGDGQGEMEAASAVREEFNPSPLVKTVKLKEAPTVPEIFGQLRKILQELENLVFAGQNLHYQLTSTLPSQRYVDLTQWASAWMQRVRDEAEKVEDAGTRGGYALATNLGLLVPPVGAKG